MLLDDIISIIPKVIDNEDNIVHLFIENIIDTIGIYKEIECQFKPSRPTNSNRRSFPHRRSSIFINSHLIQIKDENVEEQNVDIKLF